jgi:hypothetical protein
MTQEQIGLQMPGMARYVIYLQGADCLIWDTIEGQNVTNDPTDPNLKAPTSPPEDAIQFALNLGWNADHTRGPGDVYISAGVYEIGFNNNKFAGLSVRNFTTLKLDPNAEIVVPNGYKNSAFVLAADDASGVNNTIIDGGWVHEDQNPRGVNGPPTEAQGLWTAFHLIGVSGSDGVYFNKIMNTRVDNARVGVLLEIGPDSANGANLSFVNSNTFDGLRLIACGNFVNFALAKPIGDYNPNPVWGNTFTGLRCEVQCAEVNASCNQKNIFNPVATTVGINNVLGNRNSFIDVQVWDIQRAGPNGKKMVVTPDADSTLFVGGILYEAPNDFGSHTTTYGN